MESEVRAAVAEDQKWVGKLFDANRRVLGNMSGGTMFFRWLKSSNPREKMIVIDGLGFAHYLERRDGVKVIYEIAVAVEAKRRGVGRKLVEAVGFPCQLKTDADHYESNAFYKRLGFRNVGVVMSKSGKAMNVYHRWQ